MAKFFSLGKEKEKEKEKETKTKTETENRDFCDLCQKVNSRDANIKDFLGTAYWSENSAWYNNMDKIRNGTKLLADLNDIFSEIINFIKKHHENEIISRNLVILKDKIQLNITLVMDRKKLIEEVHVERMIKKKEQEQKKEELEQQQKQQIHENKCDKEWEETQLKDNFTEKINRFKEMVKNNPFMKKHGINVSCYYGDQKNNLFVIKMEYACQTKPRGGTYYFCWYPTFDPVTNEIRSIHSFACRNGGDGGYYPGPVICMIPIENVTADQIHQCIIQHPLVEKIHCE
ncbi:MAG: hypothetical protein Terrestrivirus5_27 [Terrestrivirus sp.]|uniref:Uncharacterized protein n=1 Tax=Terrestrivirus sp. TaxID=2487775 RepID=A0A3G4ZMX0_9VIRU|nr:MAG: hypothetical protein Terrestrivirus5_27 [Terrestrivirus sp.]